MQHHNRTEKLVMATIGDDSSSVGNNFDQQVLEEKYLKEEQICEDDGDIANNDYNLEHDNAELYNNNNYDSHLRVNYCDDAVSLHDNTDTQNDPVENVFALQDTASDYGSEQGSLDHLSLEKHFALTEGKKPDNNKHENNTEPKKNNFQETSHSQMHLLLEIGELKQKNKFLSNRCAKLKNLYENISNDALKEQEKLDEEIVELKKKNKKVNEELAVSQQKEVENQQKICDLKELHTKELQNIALHHKEIVEKAEISRQEQRIKELEKVAEAHMRQYENSEEKHKISIEKMKQDHKKEVKGFLIENKNLLKENTQLLQHVTERRSKSMSDFHVFDKTSTPTRGISNSLTSSTNSLQSLNLSSNHYGIGGAKPFEQASFTRRCNSELRSLEVELVEGVVRFIECKEADTNMFVSYEEWYTRVSSEVSTEFIHQLKRHIFVQLKFDLPVDENRKQEFFATNPKKLEFGKASSETVELCRDGWPLDIDYFFILHPSIAGKFFQLQRNIVPGTEHVRWHTAKKIKRDYFYETEDENEKCYTILLCAYVKEQK